MSMINTMKAYEQLADEGLITAAQGKGFYVNAQDSEMIKVKGPIGVGKAVARVNGKVACMAELTFAIG